MTVVARKRGHRTTHYVVVTWRGRRVWERCDGDKREAQRLERRRLQEIKDETYLPPAARGMTVARYAEAWLSRRTNRTSADESGYMRTHVLSRRWLATMRMESVRNRHMQQLVDELHLTISVATGKLLSPKTVANIFGVVRTMFRSALRTEDIDRDPCMLPKGMIARGAGATRAPYKVAEIRQLLSSPKVTLASRVFAALALLTGMREGEVCGRRWRDWGRQSRPLGCLSVDTQYDGRPLKTDKPGAARGRRVPVHPALAQLLTAWWESGFELVYCRPPTDDDFIVPQADGAHHTRSSAYKAWVRALVAAGVANRSLHSTRHTFISMCRQGGAPKDVVERITHNARGDVLDQYTHFDWAPLCAAVFCLPFGANVDENVDGALLTSAAKVEAPGIEPRGHGGNERELLAIGGLPARGGPRRIPQDSTIQGPIVARVNDSAAAPRFPLGEATANLYELLAAKGAA